TTTLPTPETLATLKLVDGFCEPPDEFVVVVGGAAEPPPPQAASVTAKNAITEIVENLRIPASYADSRESVQLASAPIRQTTWPVVTGCPGSTERPETSPPRWACTSFSIFIASTMQITAPASTSAPS